jgi:hypothetical protein
MKRFSIAFAVCVVGLSLGVGSLLAHHGRSGTYDTDREVEMKGTVSELLWRSPHIAIYLDVTDANGDVETWVIEHSNLARLASLEYGRNTLQVGTEVTARKSLSVSRRLG